MQVSHWKSIELSLAPTGLKNSFSMSFAYELCNIVGEEVCHPPNKALKQRPYMVSDASAFLSHFSFFPQM